MFEKSAAPAYPGIVEYTQPGGNVIRMRRYGDERRNFAVVLHDGEEYVVKEDGNGTFNYVFGALTGKLPDKSARLPVPADSLPPPQAIKAGEYMKTLPPPGEPEPKDHAPAPTRVGASPLNGKTIVVLVEFDPADGAKTLFSRNANFYGAKTPEQYWHDEVFGILRRQLITDDVETGGGLIRPKPLPRPIFALVPNRESVNGFYYENSNGRFQFTPEELPNSGVKNGVYRVTLPVPHPNTWSADLGDTVPLVIQQMQDTYGFSFSDSYHDSYTPNVFSTALHIVLVIAGGEAACFGPSPCIWGHKGRSSFSGVSYDYVAVGEQQSSVNLATIGVICHELGHSLGAPDLYHVTGYQPGNPDDEKSPGYYSLMDVGCWGRNPDTVGGEHIGETPTHFDAWNKIGLGWYGPVAAMPKTLAPAGNPRAYQTVKIPSPDANQYFLIENRQKIGFDQGLGGNAADGVLAWRVDDFICGGPYNYNCYLAPNIQGRHGMTLIPKDGGAYSGGYFTAAAYGPGDEFFLTYHADPRSSTDWRTDTSKIAYPRACKVVSDGASGLTAELMGALLSAVHNLRTRSFIIRWSPAATRDFGFTYKIYASPDEADLSDLSALASGSSAAVLIGTVKISGLLPRPPLPHSFVWQPTRNFPLSKGVFFNVLVEGPSAGLPANTTAGKAIFEPIAGAGYAS